MAHRPKGEQVVRLDRLQELCMECLPEEGRESCGYGYVAFRKLVKVSNSAFYRVMYRGRDFSISTYYDICKKFGVSMDWLMGFTDVKYLEANNEEE